MRYYLKENMLGFFQNLTETIGKIWVIAGNQNVSCSFNILDIFLETTLRMHMLMYQKGMPSRIICITSIVTNNMPAQLQLLMNRCKTIVA